MFTKNRSNWGVIQLHTKSSILHNLRVVSSFHLLCSLLSAGMTGFVTYCIVTHTSTQPIVYWCWLELRLSIHLSIYLLFMRVACCAVEATDWLTSLFCCWLYVIHWKGPRWSYYFLARQAISKPTQCFYVYIGLCFPSFCVHVHTRTCTPITHHCPSILARLHIGTSEYNGSTPVFADGMRETFPILWRLSLPNVLWVVLPLSVQYCDSDPDPEWL